MNSRFQFLSGFLPFTVVAVIFLSLGLSQNLCAQDGVRVFPNREIVHAQMPPALRMESADGFDDEFLVVWSTMEVRDDGDTVAVLYGQHVAGYIPQGDPFILHTGEARPRSYVGVLAVRNAFVVIWNDYRRPDSSRVFMQVVKRGANFVGIEQPVEGPLIGNSGIRKYGDPEYGRIAGWGETGQTFLEFDVDGRLRREPLSVPFALLEQRFGIGEEELTVLELDKGKGLVLDERAARIREDSIPDDRLLYPHWIGSDGTLSMVRGDSIYLYTTLSDSTPQSALAIPFYDSVVAGAGFIWRDTTGDYMLVFSTLYDGLKASDRYGPFHLSSFSLVVRKISISSTGSLLGVDTLGSVIDLEGYATLDERYFHDWTLAKTEVTRVCRNTFVLKHIVNYHFYSAALAVQDRNYRFSLCMEIAPPFVRAFDCDTCPTKNDFHCDVLLSPFNAPLKVVRTAADYRSGVRLITEEDSLEFFLPTAITLQPDTVEFRTSRFAPALMARDSVLLLLHKTLDSKVKLYRMEEAGKILRPLGDPWFHCLTPKLQDFRPVTTYVEDRFAQSGFGAGDTLLRGVNGVVQHGYRSRGDEYNRFDRLAYESWSETMFSYRTCLGIPTVRGWVVPTTPALFPLSTQDSRFVMDQVVTARNPNTGVTLYHLRHPTFGIRNIHHLDNGEYLRSPDKRGPGHASVPLVLLDSTTYLGLYQNHLYEVSDTAAGLVDTNTTGLNPDDTYVRLLGDYFLSLRFITDSEVLLRLYSLDRRLLRSEVHPYFSGKELVSLHQNPVDSSLVLLFAVPEGLRATFYRKDLRLLVRDSLLIRSGTLQDYSAVFRKDTLVVVWQDNRDGYPDLFQQRMWLPAPPAADSSTLAVKRIERGEGGILSAVRILPNPASRTATLMFDLSAPLLLPVRIYDDLGRMAHEYPTREYPSGTGTLPLDLQNLPPGGYTVVAGAGKNQQIVRLMIAP